MMKLLIAHISKKVKFCLKCINPTTKITGGIIGKTNVCKLVMMQLFLQCAGTHNKRNIYGSESNGEMEVCLCTTETVDDKLLACNDVTSSNSTPT